MRPWLIPVLVLLQVVAVACAGDQKVVGTKDAKEDVTTPGPAASTDVGLGAQHAWNPYQDGWELVNEAMAEFRKIRNPFHRRSRKQTGMFGTLFHYALKALPSLRVSAPPQEHAGPVITGPLLEGVKLLGQSADQNNTDAIYLLAQLNFFGNYSHPRNFKTAFDHYYRLASQHGNSSAQYMVGMMYGTGVGDAVERDQAKALLYHTFAANQGHTRSEMTVAARHMQGIGAPKNCETACKYYKRVADKAMAWFRSGPPGGMTLTPEAYRISDEFGGVYGEGASVISSGIYALKASPNSDAYASIDDVIEYLDLMSQKGDFKASFNLGRLYYEGQRGLDRNVELARRYFLGVAQKHWRSKDDRVSSDPPRQQLEKVASKAAGYIGRMYLRGEGVKQDFKTAQRWFERGIKYADAQSQWGLGTMFLHGYGVSRNIGRATELFKASADQDYSLSNVALGALYLDQGQADDLKIASSYFEAALRWANIEAQYYLAEMIHHGVGRDKTCSMAMAYYKNVAEKAEPLISSWAEANQAYEDGDMELAFLDYVMAAEQGYEKAQNNVAYILDETHSVFRLPSWLKRQAPRPGLLQNSALALIYWTRSAIQSNIDSLVKMGDYYLHGIGTQVALDKAAQCYGGASEYFQSAQALYNLGWMHENGVGLTQDYHLAKRYYDHALETNEEAYLPVTLSLLKLRLRSAWNTFTNGRINSIQDEPSPRKEWSIGEWVSNFVRDDDGAYYGDEAYDDYYDDDVDAIITGSDGQPMGGGDGVGGGGGDLDEELLDGVIESLVILGLVGAIIWLMWYRAHRQQAHRRAQQQQQQQQQENNNAAAAAAAAAAVGAGAAGAAGGAGGPGWEDRTLSRYLLNRVTETL
ncbi:HCP-like protein [Xylariaceae sp. FL0804]|nr:HCP-like protein [Xylariaceae sp. FL0804]